VIGCLREPDTCCRDKPAWDSNWMRRGQRLVDTGVDEPHLFGTPDSEMKPSKSNSVNSRRENDLESLGAIGWVLGTEFATS